MGDMMRRRIWRLLRQYFLTGLFALIPVVVTVYIGYRIFTLFDQVGRILGVNFPGFGLLVTIILITLFGMLVNNILGQQIVQVIEWVFARVPVLKSVYEAIKQIISAVFEHSGGTFRRVVLVPFGGQSGRSLAFVVREEDEAGKIAVFLPFSPPTAGYLIVYDRKDVESTNLKVEEAMRIVLSGGTLLDTSAITGPQGSVD